MFKSLTVLLFVAITAALFAGVAHAGVITFSVPTITLTESSQTQTGYFDVTVYETGSSDTLYQFQVDLLLPTQSNVTFLAGDYDPATTYVFAGNTGVYEFDSQVFVAPNEAAASDSPDTNTGTALSSTPLGLMRVEYSVAPNFVGTESLTFNQNPSDTYQVGGDPYADFINTYGVADLTHYASPGAVVNGAIVVIPVPTPEPSSLVLLAIGTAALWIARRCRKG